jgi:uncharacterized protein YjbI with pentapeptide repeats
MQHLQQEFNLRLDDFCITLSEDEFPSRYLVNIELANGQILDRPDQLLDRFEYWMREFNNLYGTARESQVPPPRLRILAPGSFAQLRQRQVERGMFDSQLKIPHISEDRNFLSGLPVLQEFELDTWGLNVSCDRIQLQLKFIDVRSLKGAHLIQANLSQMDLSNADLAHSDLSGANLSGVNLSYADLTGAYLREANLTDADLTGAILNDTDLTDANLSRASLRKACLEGAYLTRTNLEKADLTDAQLNNAFLWQCSFKDANLIHANFHGAELRQVNLTNTQLQDANLPKMKREQHIGTPQKDIRQEIIMSRNRTDS